MHADGSDLRCHVEVTFAGNLCPDAQGASLFTGSLSVEILTSSLERSKDRGREKYVNYGQSEPIRATRGWLELVGS